VARAGELVTGGIGVFFDDANATTGNLQARFRDSIDTLNVAFGAYGVSLVEVAAAADAVIVVEVAASSEGGTAADGLLGYSVAGHITLLSGWNWYVGADPLLIGSDQYDLQTIMTHELGHSTGLAHSGDGGSVMYRMLTTSETRRSVTATDLTLLEAEAASTPQALWAAPRRHSDVIAQPGTINPVSTQFLVPSPHLFADSNDETATVAITVKILNFAEMPGVPFDRFGSRFFTTHQTETVRTIPNPDLPLWTLQFASDHERLFPMKELENDESNLTAKAAGLPIRRPSKAEEVDHLFANFRENLEDELLAV
jgi:hypothetical protein